MNYKMEIESRLSNKRHLIPIYESVYYIPERIKEYDPNFFVVFNTRRQTYEIHSLENPVSTYSLTVPYNQLDVRAIRHLWKNDIRMRGEQIFKEVEQNQNMMEQEQQRDWKRWVEDVAKETQPLMAKTAWT